MANQLFTVLFYLMVAAFGAAEAKMLPNPSGRIVGGANAIDGQFPYIVSLSIFEIPICAGAIVHESWVLTAASCLEMSPPSLIYIDVGSVTPLTDGYRYQALRVLLHELYELATSENDIALVKTFIPMKLSANAQIIPLGTGGVPVGSEAFLAGWGLTSYPGSDYPKVLRFIKLKTISNEDCQDYYDESTIFDTQLCTLTKEGEGMCQGDSGSPLVRDGQLVGLVSWGRPCAIGYPDIYTNAAAFSAWVNEKIAENGDD